LHRRIPEEGIRHDEAALSGGCADLSLRRKPWPTSHGQAALSVARSDGRRRRAAKDDRNGSPLEDRLGTRRDRKDDGGTDACKARRPCLRTDIPIFLGLRRADLKTVFESARLRVWTAVRHCFSSMRFTTRFNRAPHDSFLAGNGRRHVILSVPRPDPSSNSTPPLLFPARVLNIQNRIRGKLETSGPRRDIEHKKTAAD